MARVLLLLVLLHALQSVDLDKVLEKADKALDEAKAAYEEARDKSSAAGFVDAGFKLEEARIKYLVLQEVGNPAQQKTAGDRIRAVNQLVKLIHDGKVAISGATAGEAATKPAEPSATPNPAKPEAKPGAEPTAPAVKPPTDVRVRLAVPDPARQKEAEKLVRDILKEQYAKKSPADRQTLARLLLQQTKDASNDPAALWVMFRDAQDNAAQVCDLPTVLASVEGTASYFDVDGLALKNTALAAAGKNAKTPDDFGALTRAVLTLIDDLVAADQYDVADKAAASALVYSKKTNDIPLSLKVTIRSKEIVEAKTLYQGMKTNLETLAKNPEDPAANNQMGQLLCFVKGNWDLGLRFLIKGSDTALKTLAQKEQANSLQSADQVAIADGWWDLAEKEKSGLRKNQMQVHAREFYESALPGLNSLQRIKVEKRMEAVPAPGAGAVIDLLRLVDPAKDAVAGTWTLKGGTLVSDGSQAARIEFPYEPPADYDFRIVFIRNEGSGDVYQSLTRSGKSFLWTMNCGPHYGFGDFKGRWVAFDDCQGGVILPSGIINGKTYTSLVQVRKDGVKGFLDGKLIKELKDPYGDLGPHDGLRLRKDTLLGAGCYQGATTFLKIELVEISGKGKKTR